MSRLLRARRTLAVAVVSMLLLVTAVVYASSSNGYATTNVSLSGESVWVTNSADGLVGRVNRQIDQLNSAVKSNRPFDVLQGDDAVFVRDDLAHQLRPVDVGTVTLGAKIGLPVSASVSLGGGLVGIGDPVSGRVWAGTADSLAGLDPASAAPLLTTAPHVQVVMSPGGKLFAVAAGSDKLWSITLDAGGSPVGWKSDATGKSVPPSPAVLAGGALSAAAVGQVSPVQITAVGDVPVVLDRVAGVVIVGGHRVVVPGAASAVLQQPGPASDAVLVATSTSLLKVPLDGAAVQVLSSQGAGVPAAPVLLDGCVHGAWGGAAPVYAHGCGSDPVTVVPVPASGAAASAATGGPSLVFRVNAHVIVLNDSATGNVWLVDQQMKVVNNWDDVQPEAQQEPSPGNNGSTSTSDQLTSSRVDCKTQAVEKPAPAADVFGVRAGRSTVLPVLDNDASADCSMVTIASVTPLPKADGTVEVVNGGQDLQIDLPPGVSGPLPSLDYTVDDGNGNRAVAGVAVTVIPAAEQPAPKSLRPSATSTEINGTVSYDVLSDFSSPAGDDLFLVGASTKSDDAVTYQPDGIVTFHDLGTSGAIKKEVSVIVSDGTNETDGTLTVQVLPEGGGKPTASPVFAQALVGESTVSNPLASVTSPGLDPVQLVRVTPKTGGSKATASIDPTTGTVSLKGSAPGSYYFTYDVASGQATSSGVIRFDVDPVPVKPLAPVVMTDTGYLVQGRTLVVDPLANDVDPMGGVLSIQQLDNPAGSPLTATVRDLHLVQISSSHTVPVGGTALTYTVTNGTSSTTGQIRVVPVPAPTVPQAPVASDVSVTVRAGDAVSIPIAQHAVDPGGEALTVEPVAPGDALPAAQGLVFTTPTEIRYLAPKIPPGVVVKFKYTVVNTDLLTDSGTVTVSVTSGDTAVNQAPRTPVAAVARVFQGQQVTVGLPLDGIDPDGDWVTYAGQADPAPASGRVDQAGPDAVTYTAIGATGLDSFGYLAGDPYGKSSTGLVTVAVVPRPSIAAPPVAPDLKVTVRPGRAVSVDLLGAASDPGGNVPFSFSDPAFVLPPGITASLVKNQLVVRAPATEGVFPIQYTVLNSKKLAASGILTVTVSKTAVLDPPTAGDVFADKSMLNAAKSAVSFDLAANLTNPSGQVSDLKLALDPVAGGTATISGTRITVPLVAGRQVLAYKVTNLDGGTAQAFIVVPPMTQLVPPPAPKVAPTVKPAPTQPVAPVAPPSLKPSVTPFTINAGETKTLTVPDYVDVGPGRSVQIPSGSALSASQGTVKPLSSTTLQYSVPDTAAGNAYITLTVSDGIGRPVTLDIPVVIIPKVVPPPVFSSASIQVEKGKSAQQDLSGLVATANATQQAALRYSGPSGLTGGLTGSVSGSTLTVSAPLSAKVGSSAVATVSVTDGKNTVSGQITVTVVGSTAPQLRLSQLPPVNATAGQPLSLPVLAGSYDPFPTTPLTIVSASSNNGTRVQINGGSLSVTPPAAALTQFIVTFSVADATGDTSRNVSGSVTVIPQAKPSAPTQVIATSLGLPDQVSLSWHDPALVRPDITAHTVYFTGGTQKCGSDTTCTIKALTPGKPYTFKVSATNSLGEGPQSGPSNQITPDTAPGQPQAPTVAWAAPGALDVSWTPPPNKGSPIVAYVLTTNGVTHTVTGATTYRWINLNPATGYSITVAAVNASKQQGQPSPGSGAVYPVGPTPAPGQPQLTTATSGGQRTIQATWKAPSPIYPDKFDDHYTITAAGSDGSTPTCTAGGALATSCMISGVTDGVGYKVTVVYVNIAGPSSPATSGSASTSPDNADVTNVAANGTNGQLKYTVGGASNAGGTVYYEVTASGSGGKTEKRTAAGTYVMSGLSNGTKYTLSAVACVSSSTCGSTGQTDTGKPYGPIDPPVVDSQRASGTTVSFTWHWPASGGNGRTVASQTATVNGTAVSAGGSWSGDVGYSKTVNLALKFCVSGPSSCTTATGTATTGAAPPPPPPPPPAGQPETSDTKGATGQGAPTYPSYDDVSGTGAPFIPSGTTVQVKCYKNVSTIGTDGGRWYQISSGAADGRWSPSNNFKDSSGAGLPAC